MSRAGSKLRRIRALVRKETLQMLRDPSSIAIGIVLPLVMILLFGYALSLDVEHVPVAVVVENPTPAARDLAGGFVLSRYFDVRQMRSMQEARQLMLNHDIDAIIDIPADFERRARLRDAEVQVIVHGVDANRARIIEGYARGVIGQWLAGHAPAAPAGQVDVRARVWFNPALESHYFLVPGLLVLVMTLIGALMTALVMAREWERGTLEALFVTPVRSDEILLGKTVPYFFLGMVGLTLCVLASRFLFHVPVRGSLGVLVGVSSLYLLVALGLGLAISAATKNQFLASQLALITTFMPAVMLSGFVYDIGNMPRWVQMVTYIVPARYYVALLQTLFLAGDVWSVIVPNATVLVGMAALLLIITRGSTRKRLA